MIGFKTYYLSPLGWTIIESNGKAITALRFLDTPPAKSDIPLGDDCLAEAVAQLDAYFQQKLKVFDLPLAAEGTTFQQQVWDSLLKIPYGTTSTYLTIALRSFRREYSRAIGQAVGANPISIIIPCHRVVGSDGDLTGFSGGIDKKRSLLSLENSLEFAPQTRLFS